MSYARYYITLDSTLLATRPAFTAGTPLRFTAGGQWKEMTIRGVDSRGAAVPARVLKTQMETQPGGGTLLWVADHIYECVFSDRPIDQSFLDSLRPAAQKPIFGLDLLCDPHDPAVAKFGDCLLYTSPSPRD